jgi:hypothetical protein
MSLSDLQNQITNLEQRLSELERDDRPEWHFETLVNLTDWFDESLTSADNGVIDLSADFDVPAKARAVQVRVDIIDNSITAVTLGDQSGGNSLLAYTGYGNSHEEWISFTALIACDANGDIWLTIDAGVTIRLSLFILAYYI